MKIPADRRTGSDGKSGHYFTDRFMSRLMRLTPQLQRPLGHPIHVFICLGRCAGGAHFICTARFSVTPRSIILRHCGQSKPFFSGG